MTHWIRLPAAILISAALHALVFWYTRSQQPKSAPSSLAPVQIEVMNSDKPKAPPVPPIPRDPEKEEAEIPPSRIASDVSEEETVEDAVTDAAEMQQPSEDLEEMDVVEKTASDEGVNREAAVEEAAFVHEPVERVKEENLSAEEIAEKISAEEKDVVKTSMSEDEYSLFLRKLPLADVQGKKTPNLVFAYRDLEEMLKIQRYYRMKVIALDVKKYRTVVEVTGLGGQNVDFQKIDNFNWKAYSNRLSPRSAPFFENIRKQILRRGLLSGDVIVACITPNGPDTYFSYKQLEAVRRVGLKPEDVKSTVARFFQLPFGGWVLTVEKILQKNGSVITVEDFELKELKGR